MLRFVLWRLLGLLAAWGLVAVLLWLLGGGLGETLRGSVGPRGGAGARGLSQGVIDAARAAAILGPACARGALVAVLGPVSLSALVVVLLRVRARSKRRYVRLRIHPYRGDYASVEELVAAFDTLHNRLQRRWWRRLLHGQPSLSLEVHSVRTPTPSAWLAICVPRGYEQAGHAALRNAYPNVRVGEQGWQPGVPPVVVRLKKHEEFIGRARSPLAFERWRDPPMNRLLTTMGASGGPVFVQLALTPTPASFEAFARHLYRRREDRLSRRRHDRVPPRDRSLVADAELRGALELQHRSLFFADVRVVAPTRGACELVSAELRSERAENRLVERGTAIRQGLLGLYTRRVRRGEGNPLPSFRNGVFSSVELATLWQLPSVDYLATPFARAGLPLAPAPPDVFRPTTGEGTLRDSVGAVSIHESLRKQNVAVPGTVEQGKSSFLVASVAEDLRRDRCAVIVLDPKGDAAEAAVAAVPPARTCTLLDLAYPTCGFNPLEVDAPADVIADFVVASLKNLFTDADIRASSDRYLRNAIIAVLAYDRRSTLWDAARLLSVGQDGYAYRRAVADRVREFPAFKEISDFFTSELSAQLADARSTTTSKLDAPVNKLARLLNSPSIKRVLLNRSLTIDLDHVIAESEVLVVKGALGTMGAGNTSVVMQLLVGMLDAALARQQDLVPAHERVAVALKIDEAPLAINRGFAETMALKRSAGLETVACWQSDAQWVEPEVRDQLDALFAHRVYFATASARDAREAVALTMAEFSDMVRPGVERLSSLGRPDVRLHLPKHHAIVSWTTPLGRQPAFVAETIPMTVDPERLELHAQRQRERGGEHLHDLHQPHWERRTSAEGPQRPTRSDAGDRSPADGSPSATAAVAPALPPEPAESFRELVEIDRAHSVRPAPRLGAEHALAPDALDLEMLALIAAMRHVLTSQLHRHFNPARAATTTQRRLKRLADAAFVDRFQFYRRDGGGIPMCYAIAAGGLRTLQQHGLLEPGVDDARCAVNGFAPTRRDRLRQARRDVHVTGWSLALVGLVADDRPRPLGPDASVIAPPTRSAGKGRATIGPLDLCLPAGRTPHAFGRTSADGAPAEIERFETIRPDATVRLPPRDGDGGGVDLLVELDDRLASGAIAAVAKLERYDHFLSGWSAHTRRYGARRQATPVVVFVCASRERARDCARTADRVLCASRAYAGEHPQDWQYPGRELVRFVSERDVHEGLSFAYGVPRCPPSVRVRIARGDPSAGETVVLPRDLLA